MPDTTNSQGPLDTVQRAPTSTDTQPTQQDDRARPRDPNALQPITEATTATATTATVITATGPLICTN